MVTWFSHIGPAAFASFIVSGSIDDTWFIAGLSVCHMSRGKANAIAPGFFLTEQNRYLMVDAQSGSMTSRGQKIIDHTPMGRLGVPDDLLGTLLWLVSPASAFVTGVVVPIDGGFSSFSGV
jgi:NAD(P)-dependent dehydrogenase (short-subunit alcohol dehydrogenase family)